MVSQNGGLVGDETAEYIREERSKTFDKWKETFHKVYNEWQEQGYDPEKTFPHPTYIGFKPDKKKKMDKIKAKILSGVKRGMEKKEKQNKEVPNKKEWNLKREK